MLYIILKTKYMPVAFSGCDYAYFTSKRKQAARCNIIHFTELVYCENVDYLIDLVQITIKISYCSS